MLFRPTHQTIFASPRWARAPLPATRRFRPQVDVLEDRLVLDAVRWINPAGGAWSDPANWSSNRVPGTGDDVQIDLPENIVITDANASPVNSLAWTGGTISGTGHVVANQGLSLSGHTNKHLNGVALDNGGNGTWANDGRLVGDFTASINNLSGATFDIQTDSFWGFAQFLTFNNTGTLIKDGDGSTFFAVAQFNNSGVVSVQGGQLSLDGSYSNGSYTLAAGTVLKLDGGSNLLTYGATVDGDGMILVSQHATYVDGTVTVQNLEVGSTGTLVLQKTGVLSVAGNYQQDPGSTLIVEVGGYGVGDTLAQMNVTGQATLDGTLDVRLVNNFRPMEGDGFQILTFGARTGDFATYQGLDIGQGLVFMPTYDDTSLTLVVTSSGAARRGDDSGKNQPLVSPGQMAFNDQIPAFGWTDHVQSRSGELIADEALFEMA
jgi:hypothetical protein